MTMCAIFLIGLAILPFAPETKGKPFARRLNPQKDFALIQNAHDPEREQQAADRNHQFTKTFGDVLIKPDFDVAAESRADSLLNVPPEKFLMSKS